MTSTTTCATCPLSRQIEGNRFECTSAHKSRVTRGHWTATTDCTDAIEAHRVTLEAAVAVAEKEHEGGRIAGYYDAKFKTNTILDNDSANWLDGYWQGVNEYLDLLKTKDALHQEWEEAAALLPSGWRCSDGWFWGKGGRYSQPPVPMTNRQVDILMGFIKVH